MPTRLSICLAVAVVAGCSQLASTQSGTSALADRLATQKLLWDLAQSNKVTYSYASPAPVELPIDFLIAWQIYHSDRELFRLRIESAKLQLEMLTSLVTDPEYIAAALRKLCLRTPQHVDQLICSQL